MTLREEREVWAQAQRDSGKRCRMASEHVCNFQENDPFCSGCFAYDRTTKDAEGDVNEG